MQAWFERIILMKSIIEELYFSNLDISNSKSSNSDFEETLNQISGIENQLLEVLADDTRKLFIQYVGLHQLLTGSMGLDKFKAGFSIGTSIIIEALSGTNTFLLDDTV